MNCTAFGNGLRAYGAKTVNLGFWGVILGLRNDLTKAAGVVRLFGSVPPKNHRTINIDVLKRESSGVGLFRANWFCERDLRW